jgi:acyl dehydratase
MRIFSDFSEFKAAIGSEIGASDWIDMTQERLNLFAQATRDEQWIHIDQVPAKTELRSGITIAHGLLSLSLAPMFIRSVVGLRGIRDTLNYGVPTGSATSRLSRQAHGSGAEPPLRKQRTSRRTVCWSTITW